jgi:D-sedoheptulose 7-phosphate isomerase
MGINNSIQRYWQGLTTAMQKMPFHLLEQMVEILSDCYQRGNTIFVMGNGGSAATASHFACDLAKGTRMPGLPAFRVISLNESIPLMTAWANDTSYERIFAEQLTALVRPDDLVITFSASGNSPNVIAAALEAHQNNAFVIALTGKTGGRLADLADLLIRVPAQPIEQVEDAHLAIAHSLCVVLRERLRALAAERLEQATTVS